MAFSSSTGYDVFVSFRGEEIRRTFISHLYNSLEQKGIRAFKDETEMIPKPSEIHLATIRASRIVVVVVTKNYLSSHCFLKEILNYHRSGYLTVFPVFYGVNPRDVAEEFGTNQKQNPKKMESEICEWRKAVTELVSISGEHSNNWKDDAELILKITNDIWDKLSSLRFGTLVGMDLRTRRIYELLRMDSRDDDQVREIGIWGKAGLGKKTLARCVYREISKHFDVRVRLEDVNKIHQDHNESSVLSELLRSKLVQGSGSGFRVSPDDTSWLRDQRVLLVAGGVDKTEQLYILRDYIKLFGPGSRVIVTCTDQQLLIACGVTLLYQVESLEFYEALELLKLHAFKGRDPPRDYEQLLSRGVKIGNGYPLVVAAVGSELCGKPKQEWETVLSRYEHDTMGTEKSSFGVLNDKDRSLSENTALGMDCHMQAVSGLMELESENEIGVVGIWGVGGVGKMTLARSVYEETKRHFHINVLLENVGKIYEDHAHLEEEILWKRIQREARISKERLLNRKVLLIVDGVNNSEQLEDVKKVSALFALGSRVIVTTRDRNLLVANGIKRVYEVKCLKVHEALQLFYQYAFKQQTPSTRFKQLSVRAVQLAGRIPLNLKVLGSFLCGKSGHDWESVLQKLETQRDEDKTEVVSVAEWKSASSEISLPDTTEIDNERVLATEIILNETTIDEVPTEEVVITSLKHDLNMAVRSSDVVMKLPEENHYVERGSRSVYEQDSIPLWGMVSICGGRSEMMETVKVLPNFLKIPIKMLMEDHEGMSPSLTHLTSHFFGVYDGHGGAQVADFCHDRINFALVEAIERSKEELCKKNTGESRQVQWEKVFVDCYLKVDGEVKGKISRPGVGSSDRMVLEAVSPGNVGSTAVVALVCSSHIIVSNCGDSRAVLLRGKDSMPLSVDHKPDREDEYARIEKAGGKVIQRLGARVSGVLPISRSIGDEYLEPYVIADPEVTIMPREREDECLLLASDGLWDVMSNQEACEAARKRILLWHKKNGALSLAERGVGEDSACQAAADYLSKLASQMGSKDSISVIVVDLKAQRRFKTKS